MRQLSIPFNNATAQQKTRLTEKFRSTVLLSYTALAELPLSAKSGHPSNFSVIGSEPLMLKSE
jgi:hypothetical protein